MVKIDMGHLREVAQKAGELLFEGFSQTDKEVARKSSRELVTKYDLASESLLSDELSRYGIPVIGEEGGEECGETRFWTVDPLDGTNNFAFGIPHFAVTFALMDAGFPLFAVIYDPLRREMFTAERGGGAYLNQRRLSVSRRKKSEEIIAATGFSYDRSVKDYDNVENIRRVTRHCRGLRRMGAASLDLAYVASGRFDGYWERGLKLWDMAAGVLIVEEAGGKVTGLNGGMWSSDGDHVLATNSHVHDFFTATLERYEDKI